MALSRRNERDEGAQMTTGEPQRFEHVHVARTGAVSVVSLARPAKRNAMNRKLLTELLQALQHAQDDPAVSVIVLTGQGTVFSAGADRAPVAGLEGEALVSAFAPLAEQMARDIAAVLLQLVSMPKFVVGAINGHAAGGALIMALCCDVRIAASEAQFWMPELGMGRAIGAPSMETLVACLGPLRAKDIVVSGQRMRANDMEKLGLVNRVLPATDVLRAAQDWADELAGQDQQALSLVKGRANRGLVDIWAST